MMMRLSCLGISLCALVWPIAVAAESGGSTAFNFLSFDTNARAAGMGGAYTALASNSSALAYNPAGLARAVGNEVTLMHNQYFQGITQEYLSYSSPQGWGTSINYLSFGSVRATTLSNPLGTGLGDVGLTDTALAVGYGTKLDDTISVGVAVKAVREAIAGETGQGFMLDGGVLFKVPDAGGFTLAAAISNVGPSIKFNDAAEPLPLAVRGGAGYRFDVYGQKATVALDALQNKGEAIVYKLGCEVLVEGNIPLRAGFTTGLGNGSGISAGTGYVFQNINFDYAYVPFKDLGGTHRLSVTYRWGNEETPWRAPKRASQQAPARKKSRTEYLPLNW